MKNKIKNLLVFFVLFLPHVCFADFATEYKNQLAYIEKLKPMAQKINQEVLQKRALLENINIDILSQQDKDFLENSATEYDVFTRLKGKDRYNYIKNKLLLKVDVIAPSLLIAISGIETNWGQSRIIKEANSLYKELSWDNSGLKPQGEEQNAGYTIKKFKTLEDSMRSFLLKINSSVDYELFRYSRSLDRIKKQPIQGRDNAHLFLLKTPLKNYTGLLDYTITFYKLDELDRTTNYFKTGEQK